MADPAPAPPAKRTCALCGKPLSQYNKDTICMSHKAEDVKQYRQQQETQGKESRALFSFVQEFHREGTAQEILDTARKRDLTPSRKQALEELERYPEALGLLKVASLIFRLSMPAILRKSTSPKSKVARDVLAYLMRKDLDMPPQDIATFFGYSYLPRVAEAVERISTGMLDNEDIICAVDMVRQEHQTRVANN